MLALIVMGSAVASGIGLVGYKAFGPGDADKAGGNLSLFAPRTQPVADPNAVAPVNADGSSASLDAVASAAAKDKAAEAAAAAASASAEAPAQNTAGDPVKDAAAADAARMAAEARAASGGAINGSSGSGAAGSMHGLANVKKLGALSGAPGGGGSTSAGSGSGANVKLGENIANASKNGATSAFSRQGGAAAMTSSSSRGVARKGGSTGVRTALRNVNADQMGGRATSAGGGRTYDGAGAHGGSEIGGSGIGMDGAGDGAGAQGKSMPANAKGKPNEQDPPVPAAPAKDVTPWAKHLMGGMALGALAIAALMYASSMIKEAKALLAKGCLLMNTPATWAAGVELVKDAVAQLHLARLVIGAAMAASLGGILLGTMIAGGKNGQTLQGGLLIASSVAIGGIATMMMMQTYDYTLTTTVTGGKVDVQCAAFEAPTTWMYLIGGMAAVGLVGTMMAPHKTCKEGSDGCHAYYQRSSVNGTYIA